MALHSRSLSAQVIAFTGAYAGAVLHYSLLRKTNSAEPFNASSAAGFSSKGTRLTRSAADQMMETMLTPENARRPTSTSLFGNPGSGPLRSALESAATDIHSCRVIREERARDGLRNDRRTCICAEQSGRRRLLHSGRNGLHFGQRHADQAAFR